MSALLRSALWYLKYWGMNPLFNNIWKMPLHEEWTPFYMAEIRPEDVVREYNSIVNAGKRPAGVALVPSKSSRVVVLDIDKTEGLPVIEVAKRLASKNLVVAITPRGGLRIAFRVKEGDYLPHRIVIERFDEKIGEGGGTFKHPWTFPPSVACVKATEDGGKQKCVEVRHYFFVLPDGKLVKYPWELPWKEPPEASWEDAKTLIELTLQAKVEVPAAVVGGELKVGASTGVQLIPIPCWRSLEEFKEWLETDGNPPLPPCVATALGYEAGSHGMFYTGRKVPHGLRYTMGAIATMFLAACIAEFDLKELVDFVGEHLEDYPADEGEPLNTKLSRLLVRVGNVVVPRYSGLGSIAGNLPPELCKKCDYVCMRDPSKPGVTVELDRLGHPEAESGIRKPWITYALKYYALRYRSQSCLF